LDLRRSNEMLWAIVFFALGAGLIALIYWLRNNNISLKWYDWILGIVGIALVLAAIEHFAGSAQEGYSTAGWMGALFFGLPGLILLAVAWQLAIRRAS
jgi:hypothetical protein